LASGQGSGKSMNISTGRKNSFKTDKKGDRSYDSLVKEIAEWSKNNRPMKSSGSSKLFEIPEYNILNDPHSEYDIWGGEQEPKDKIYMVVEEDEKIINLFDNKNEAINWIKSLT